jgi:xanthine dehydrogenase accessory factor
VSGVGCAILAAGASRRLGRPKQLVAVGDTTLLGHAARAACASRCRPVAVVLGSEAGRIAPCLDGLPVERLLAPGWQEGMAASLRAAVAWAAGRDLDALVVALCDQPALSAAHLDRLLAAREAGAARVGSRHGEVVSAPALFGRGDFARLARLTGDRGAAAVLRAPDTVVVDWPAGALDIDTEEDVARLRAGP